MYIAMEYRLLEFNHNDWTSQHMKQSSSKLVIPDKVSCTWQNMIAIHIKNYDQSLIWWQNIIYVTWDICVSFKNILYISIKHRYLFGRFGEK